MSSAAPQMQMSYAEYLRFVEQAETKHEYIRGEVLAMAGGTIEHVALAMAVGAELRAALRDKPCRIYSGDLRIRVPATDFAGYPDATVVCDQVQTAEDDPHGVINPKLIVEVLSDSTEAYDRGHKFAHYRRIEALAGCLFVSQHEPRLELYVRNAAGHWELHEAGAGEQLEIAALGVWITVDEIYRDPLAST